MILVHHDLRIKLDDAWWDEAGMAGFVPQGRTFHPDLGATGGQTVFEARIDEVAPLRRKPGIGILTTMKRPLLGSGSFDC